MTEIIKLSTGENLSPSALSHLAAAAKSCKIVAFPTDTVYGVGSTGLIKAASRRIYQIKERSTLKPLPVLVKSVEAAKRWLQWTEQAELLARKFWPGALTLVLRPTEEGRLLTFGEYQTVAVRVPAHPVILSLLEASDIPWVSTSANLSGRPAITDGAELIKQFVGHVDHIIDAGPVPGTESTIVDASQAPVRVIREGALKTSQIMEALKPSAS